MRNTSLLLALAALAASPALAADNDLHYNPDRILVGFDKAGPQQVRIGGMELEPVREWPAIGAAAVQVPYGSDASELVEALVRTGQYRWVELDYVRTASATVDDPYYSYQWHFTNINLEGAWDYGTGSGALVAVVDSGLNTGGSDTPVNIHTDSYDYVDSDTNPSDQNGHGTHVAGTIAQASDNSVGVAGIAYDAELLVMRVLDASGSGYTSDVVDAVIDSADLGADVITMSLGSSYSSSTEESACDYAEAAGALVLAAAGNDGSYGMDYPGAYASVMAVGATDYNDDPSYYSNYGPGIEIAAPGGDVYADENGDGFADGVLQETFDSGWSYYFYQGTSMATPHVAGVAALLIGQGATGSEARTILQDTAVDLGSAGFDNYYGYGLLDAEAAMVEYDTNYGTSTDADGDGYDDTVDCDDTDASIYPGATEVPYDGIDQDCDGADLVDVDGDGYAYGTDCDDTDATVNPAATEIPYDGIDQDCDGADLVDVDDDGYDYIDDCDDADASVYPGALEVCNGIDDDCDSLVDADDPSLDASSAGTWYPDGDGDGYGDSTDPGAVSCSQPLGYVADATDCDDSNASAWPGAVEVAYDGIDQDCDGADLVDVDGDGYAYGADCDDTDASVNPAATEVPYDGIDQDCDGSDLTDVDGDGYDVGADCDDTDASIHPGATEVYYDGIDSDCDGTSDYDADGDGYDSDAWGGTDCDDTDASINPGATEVVGDGIDQDCDGADGATDTTPPVVSGVTDRAYWRYLTVSFSTDEDATSVVCTNTGYCASTSLGTSHNTGWFYGSKWRTYTITVTDTGGNTASYGPYSK